MIDLLNTYLSHHDPIGEYLRRKNEEFGESDAYEIEIITYDMNNSTYFRQQFINEVQPVIDEVGVELFHRSIKDESIVEYGVGGIFLYTYDEEPREISLHEWKYFILPNLNQIYNSDEDTRVLIRKISHALAFYNYSSELWNYLEENYWDFIDFNQRDNEGYIPLEAAAFGNNINLINIILCGMTTNGNESRENLIHEYKLVPVLLANITSLNEMYCTVITFLQKNIIRF